MSNTVQFRCGKCLKLLYKWNIKKECFEYRSPNTPAMKNDETGDMEMGCPKCETINKITKEGLVAIR